MAYSSVRVTFEIGHTAVVRSKKTVNGRTHDWELFIRGADNADIHHFVEKVVFNLHYTFENPSRVVRDPPFKLQESGYGDFEALIDIYLKNKHSSDPEKITFKYLLHLQPSSDPPFSNLVKERFIFHNPSEELRRRLIRGGGVGVVDDAGPNNHSSDELKNMIKPKVNLTDFTLKKMKKDGNGKNEEHHSSQNEFSALFGAPIMKDKIPCVLSSKKSNSDKFSIHQNEKQVQSASVGSKHNSSSKDKDHTNRDKKHRPRDKDNEKDRSSSKKSKEDSNGGKREKSTKKDEKLCKVVKDDTKTSFQHEEKVKDKDKLSEKLNKDVKDKEKKYRDEKKNKEKHKEGNSKSNKNIPASDRMEKSQKDKDSTSSSGHSKDLDRKQKDSDKKSIGSEAKDDKNKHHKYKKENEKGSLGREETCDREKDAGKENVKLPKVKKEKRSPGGLFDSSKSGTSVMSKPSVSKRLKKPYKQLFNDHSSSGSGSDTDSSSVSTSESGSSSGSDSDSSVSSSSSYGSSDNAVLKPPASTQSKSTLSTPVLDPDPIISDNKDRKRKRKLNHKNNEGAVIAKVCKIGANEAGCDSTTEDSGPRRSSAKKSSAECHETNNRFNDEYISKLKDLQQKIIGLEDHLGLQRIVQVVAETGQYEITTKTFDFDLCSLDESIVQRLFDFFVT